MSALSPVVDRVVALIDRAVHPGTPVEEARTAALTACKIMKKHGFVLAVPRVSTTLPGGDQPPRAQPSPANPRYRPRWYGQGGPADRFYDEHVRRGYTEEAKYVACSCAMPGGTAHSIWDRRTSCSSASVPPNPFMCPCPCHKL